MKKNTIAAIIVGLVIGVAGTLGIGAATDQNDTSKTATTITGSDHSSMSMADMTAQLTGKTGDDFDKTFLSEMISHHQGAIDMAKLVQTNAKHDEVKSLANDILAAQSKEIDMMQTWQTQWGYKTTPSIESHDTMNMSH